ncbi:mRNA-decapping enzyme 1B [Hypomesus transpacificus]|uniref:mRNA-decapping enzyme 1B n=1 Tax=Hypomesus transpacificus TaxID=137520 RepID=UPI001F082DFF|nr:mRNA-decapping enzyme 1B [Hypomesus transpacificus]
MTATSSGGNTCLAAKGLDISLAALQRQDPYIKNIVDVASQVALYTFNNRANEWEKTDVEGTLFVYTRLASPRHGFTIMNRLSMENLTEPITKDLDFQLQDPFLLYRNARLAIHGIWFYDKEDCQRIATLMRNLTQQEQTLAHQNQIQNQIQIQTQGQVQNQTQGQGQVQTQGGWVSPRGVEVGGDSKAVDILQMLNKARNEYDKGEKLSPEPKEIGGVSLHDNPNLIKPIPVKPTDLQTGLQERHTQDSEGEPRRLSLSLLFGSHPKAQAVSPGPGPGPGPIHPGGPRPAVVRSLSYDDPATPRALAGGQGEAGPPPQHCPALQKLMSSQRGGVELLQPLSESPENRLSENLVPHQQPQPQTRPDPIQRLLQGHSSSSSSAPPCWSQPPPLQQPPLSSSLQPAQGFTHPLPHHPQYHPAPLFFNHPHLHPQPHSHPQPHPQPHSHPQPHPHPQPHSQSHPQPPPHPQLHSQVVSPYELLQRLQLVQQEQSLPPHDPPRHALAPRFQEPAPPPGPVPTQPHTPSPAQKTSLPLQVISPQRIPATVAPITLLLSPSVFSQARPDCCPPPSVLRPPQPQDPPRLLSKSQLQASLLHLIQTDPSFLDTIYEAYVCRLGNSTAPNKY